MSTFTINLIEPDAESREAIAALLARADYSATSYNDLGAALGEPDASCAFLVRDIGDVVFRLYDAMESGGRLQPVIVYHDEPEPARIVDLLRKGVCDYLALPITLETVQLRLQRSLASGFAQAARDNHRLRVMAKLKLLTPRELEVMRLMAKGLPGKEAAALLGIRPRTLEIHCRNIMLRCKAKSFKAFMFEYLAASSSGKPLH